MSHCSAQATRSVTRTPSWTPSASWQTRSAAPGRGWWAGGRPGSTTSSRHGRWSAARSCWVWPSTRTTNPTSRNGGSRPGSPRSRRRPASGTGLASRQMATGLPASVPELLRARATDTGLAQRVKRFGLWQRITWSEYVADVNATAAEYVALGLEPGDRVAILSENRPEWTVADMATQTAGGATVGVYTTSSPEQLSYYLQHSDAVGLVLEDAEQLEKWLAVRHQCPGVRFVLLMEDDEAEDEGVTPYREALASGRARYAADPGPVDERLVAVRPEDVALFIYTSGTTGDPKGAMLSHANV